jgi:hypothetical protein
VGNARFSGDTDEVTFSVQCNRAGARPQRHIDFERYADMYGLKPEDLGRSFVSHGHTFTIDGFEVSRCTRPIMANREDGKPFIFAADTVAGALALGRSRSAAV